MKASILISRRGRMTFLIRLMSYEDMDAALDYIYDEIDKAFLQSYFDDVDRLLEDMVDVVKYYYTDLLIGVLTATLPAKSRLPSREELYDKCKESIDKREEGNEEYVRGLFLGLE